MEIVDPIRKDIHTTLKDLKNTILEQFPGAMAVRKTSFNEYRVLGFTSLIGVFYLYSIENGKLRDIAITEVENYFDIT